MSLQEHIDRLGLVEISTGGGCTALVKENENGVILITDDASVPDTEHDTVIVSVWPRDAEPLASFTIKGGLANIEQILI